MTDISYATPTTIRTPITLRFRLPQMGFRLAIDALFVAYGEALRMAYVEPYRPARENPAPAEDGRDPNW